MIGRSFPTSAGLFVPGRRPCTNVASNERQNRWPAELLGWHSVLRLVKDDPISKDYRQQAAEVAKMAERALNEHARQKILQIAAQWSALADERERLWRHRQKRSADGR